MHRTFGIQTLSGTAQPLFGDVLTAAMVPPASENGLGTLKVADSTRYQLGDRIELEPGTATCDIVLIEVIPDGTTLKFQSEGGKKLNAHANGSIIALSIAVADVMVQAVAGAVNPVYIGSDNTVTSSGGGKVIYQVTDSRPPFRMTYSGTHNTVRTTDAWMAALAATTVIVSATVI